MTTKPDDGARLNEWKDITPEEYVLLPRHGWDKDGTSDYHLRNIKWMIASREEAAVRAFAEDVKEKIKEQMDMVKIVPHHQSKKTEAELAHTVMVYMHQRPVDEALKERMSDLHPESTND